MLYHTRLKFDKNENGDYLAIKIVKNVIECRRVIKVGIRSAFGRLFLDSLKILILLQLFRTIVHSCRVGCLTLK